MKVNNPVRSKLKMLSAPQSIIAISTNRHGNTLNTQTIWRHCQDASDLIWLAQHSTDVTHQQVITALVACAERVIPFLSKAARVDCNTAIEITNRWLIGTANREAVLDASKAAANKANTDFDIADGSYEPDIAGDYKYIYDADDYAKAYAAIACASVSYAAVEATTIMPTREGTIADNNELDNIQIAIADLICVQEYSGHELNLCKIIRSVIPTSAIRLV